MVDPYLSAPPEYRRHIQQAQKLRAEFMVALLKQMARGVTAITRGGLQWLKCALARRRAEAELLALSDGALKDIGVTRSEIPWRVRSTLAAPCGGRRDDTLRQERMAA